MTKIRKPKIGDVVGAIGRTGTFKVVKVDNDYRTADLQLVNGVKIDPGIPWTTLAFRDGEDASQAAARIVREATENG